MKIGEEEPDNAPPALQGWPELNDGVVRFWQAFNTLSHCRTLHFNGSNPIAMSEIFAYFQTFYISDFEEREDFVYFIKELDREFLAAEAEKIKARNG